MLEQEKIPNTEKMIPRYNLEESPVNLLTQKLIHDKLPDLNYSEKFATIEIDGKSEYSNIGRYIEIASFGDVLTENTDLCEKEYEQYEDHSKFLISVDVLSERPVGVLRVIENSPAGLKTLNDVQREPFNIDMENIIKSHQLTNLNDTWDVGTVAVLPEYRGIDAGLVSVDLYRALYLLSKRNGIKHWVSVIDNKLLRVFNDYMAMNFVPLAGSEPKSYYGSRKSYAVYADVDSLYNNIRENLPRVNNQVRKNIMNCLVNHDRDNSIFFEDNKHKGAY